MKATFWEHWKHRISSAWDVLTGRAYACYDQPDDIVPMSREQWEREERHKWGPSA